MNKFKKCDQVVAKQWGVMAAYIAKRCGRPDYVFTVKCCIGNTIDVTGPNGDMCLMEDDFEFWTPPKFKKGDRVVAAVPMMVAYVTDRCGRPDFVLTVERAEYDTIYVSDIGPFHYSYFELWTPSTKFQVSDRVIVKPGTGSAKRLLRAGIVDTVFVVTIVTDFGVTISTLGGRYVIMMRPSDDYELERQNTVGPTLNWLAGKVRRWTDNAN